MADMMHTICTLDGSVEDFLNPKTQILNFDHAPHVILVGKHLRYAWPALPSEDTSPSSFKKFLRASLERPEEELERSPRDPDLESLHTPWRDTLYHQWNHVFYDVMNFLSEVNCSVGHFHPPSHDAFALKYSSSKAEKVALVSKIWDTNVLLIPAYRASGVSIRATLMQSIEDGDTLEKELGTFNDSNATEIWYVRTGVKVNFYIEGEPEEGRQGLAAVVVYGILCTEFHEQEELEIDSEQEGMEAEAQSSILNALALTSAHEAVLRREQEPGN